MSWAPTESRSPTVDFARRHCGLHRQAYAEREASRKCVIGLAVKSAPVHIYIFVQYEDLLQDGDGFLEDVSCAVFLLIICSFSSMTQQRALQRNLAFCFSTWISQSLTGGFGFCFCARCQVVRGAHIARVLDVAFPSPVACLCCRIWCFVSYRSDVFPERQKGRYTQGE